MNLRRIRIAFSIWLVVGAILVLPGQASDSDAADLDPVVKEVVEMLKAGVDGSVISQWLESTHRRPVDVGSKGVIALTEAGASEILMTTLLELVGGEKDVSSGAEVWKV